MEMHYFWIANQVQDWQFNLSLFPGKENHAPSQHLQMMPYYAHIIDSPSFLTRAPASSDLQGCVGNILASYAISSALPYVLRSQNTRAYASEMAFIHPTVAGQSQTSLSVTILCYLNAALNLYLIATSASMTMA